jgi:two-component system chemotaxis sensor kinase CheA
MQYLIFFNSTAEQCAVPLDMVARIERVSTGMIETSGGRKTMKYRDSTLPLFTLADAADTGGLPDRSDYIVIVFDLYERQAGLIAAPPVDILEVSAPVDRTTLKQKGIRGSAIIRSATTLIVDMQEIVSSVHPEWTSVLKPDGQADKTDVTILLVEDSDFFRAQITNILESAGYKVIGAVDGQAAWELFQSRGEEFTLGVFDIEMPRMNGIELAEKVRSDRRYARFPIIALSALADDDDIERAMNAGVTEYQIKLDRDKLLESVANHVKNMK